MKIYIGHSREFDYKKELYEPIRNFVKLPSPVDMILPHENSADIQRARDFYNDIDLFIAEVSFPATGLGIELGWAYDSGVPIFCISKRGTKIANSLRSITSNFLEYDSGDELVECIRSAIDATFSQ